MKVRAPRTLSLCTASSFLALALLSGCASNSNALEKRLADLREDIRRLQNDNDRVNERLEAVELRQVHAESAAAKPAAQARTTTVTRPRLKVLHLGPNGEPGEEPAAPAGAEDAPRMILKGQGKDLEIKQNAGDSSSRGGQREKTVAVSQNEESAPSTGK